MSRLYLAFGSWKLRHNEPLDMFEKNLKLVPSRMSIPADNHSILLNLKENLNYESGCLLYPSNERDTLFAGAIKKDDVPLCIVAENDEKFQILYVLLKTDRLSQFLKLPKAWEVDPSLPLWQQIYEINDKNHIFLSNHECYYLKNEASMNNKEKFEFKSNFSYLEICMEIHSTLQQGNFHGFIPQHGSEIHFWSYDNDSYEVLLPHGSNQGYVSIMNYCSERKKNWNDPRCLFREQIFNDNTSQSRESDHKNQWIDGDKQNLLEKFFDYKLSPLAKWRRSSCDILFESTSSGNIFTVSLDDRRLHDPQFPEDILQQCEIKYVKTRGMYIEEQIYQDFQQLTNLIYQYLRKIGLDPQKTHDPKLDFLRSS